MILFLCHPEFRCTPKMCRLLQAKHQCHVTATSQAMLLSQNIQINNVQDLAGLIETRM